MSNPFAEQLLKAGVVTKQQVQKANTAKKKKNKQQRASNTKVVDEAKLKAQKAAEEKAARDKALNQKKQQQAQQKAISIEINQLITNHAIKRDEDADIVYNFEHQQKVKRIYVNQEQKQQIIKGKLGIARIEGRYELVPLAIAEKIQTRNEKRVVLISENESDKPAADDPYADYQIPDDLTW